LKHRAKLDTSDKLGIAHKVIIDGEVQSDVAKEYRISNSRVSQIVKASKKKPEMTREAIEEEHGRVQQIFQLHHFINNLLADGYVIERANDVRELFNAHHGQDISLLRIKKVMREQLGMRYTKIINIAV
jgi:hypothetical protein